MFRRGDPPEAIYSFKHALVQDAAYENLLKSRRQVLHQRIAQALEKEFPETAKTEPELLALHYAGAGLADPAINYRQTAAERALQRSANVEAANHFQQALALLATLPESGKRAELELDLQTRLGATLTTVKGFAAPEVAAAYDRARILCRESQAPAQKFSVLRGLWVYDLVRAEWQAAGDLAEEMLRSGGRPTEHRVRARIASGAWHDLALAGPDCSREGALGGRPAPLRSGTTPHARIPVRKRSRYCLLGP